MKLIKYYLLSFLVLCLFSVSAQDLASNKKVRKAEKKFSIFEKSPLMQRISVRKDTKAAGNIIEIEALNVSGGSISLGRATAGLGAVLPPAEIQEINSMMGTYASTRAVSNSGRGVVMQLLDVTFPYRARITVSGQMLDIEIKEPGFWKLGIGLSQ